MANPLMNGDAVGRIGTANGPAAPVRTGGESKNALKTDQSAGPATSAPVADTVQLSPEGVKASAAEVSGQSKEATSQVANSSGAPQATNDRASVENASATASQDVAAAIAANNHEAAGSAVDAVTRRTQFTVSNGRISASVVEGINGDVVTEVPPPQIAAFGDVARIVEFRADQRTAVGDVGAVGFNVDALA